MADLSSTSQKLDRQFDRIIESVSYSMSEVAGSIVRMVRSRTLSGISSEGSPFPEYGKRYTSKKKRKSPVDLYDIPPRRYGGTHMLNDLAAYGDSGVEFDPRGAGGGRFRGAGGRWVSATDIELTIQPKAQRNRDLAAIHASGKYGRGEDKPRPWLGLTIQEADGVGAVIGRELHQIEFSDAITINFIS